MRTKTRGEYISRREWYRDVVGGEDVILCHRSALEYLQFFVGYVNEKEIEVYAKSKGIYENINYRIVNNFDDIDFIIDDGVKYATFNQTVNDMLDDFDNTDKVALAEALSDYYHLNGENFDGIEIVNPKNIENYKEMKEWAMEYYDEC